MQRVDSWTHRSHTLLMDTSLDLDTASFADITTALDDASAALDDSDWAMFSADMGADETGEEIAW